jgi:integrase
MHDLRHTAASQLIRAGVDVVQVAAHLGHSSPTTTLNTYAHIIREVKGNEAGDRLGKIFAQAL